MLMLPEIVVIATAFAVPFALVQPVLGPVGDALGKRRVIRVAICLLSVFTLLAPLAPDLLSLAVLRGLAGAAAGGVMPLSLAIVGDAVDMRDRQVALSRLVAFAIAVCSTAAWWSPSSKCSPTKTWPTATARTPTSRLNSLSTRESTTMWDARR